MYSDMLVIDRKQLSQIRDAFSASFRKLLLCQTHRLWIVVLQQSNDSFSLFEHCYGRDKTFLSLQTRRVTPKILQCIEFSFPLMENVDEHIGIVHHQPLADERAFGC